MDRRANEYNYLKCTPEITVQEMLNWHFGRDNYDIAKVVEKGGSDLNSRRTCLVKAVTNNNLNISCGNSLIHEQEEDRSNCAKLF